MHMRSSLAALCILTAVLCTPSSLLAQNRSGETLYIRPRVGLSSYLGDNEKSPFSFLSEPADAYNVDGKFPYVLGLELGYAFNPRYNLGLGVVFADYPIITQHFSVDNTFTEDHSTTRTSIQLVARYLFTEGRVAPYFQGGLHATFGKVSALPETNPARNTCLTTANCPESSEAAFGPMAGLGLDIALSPQFSIDLGISTNWTLGDTKADGRDDNGLTGGDFLTSMTAGMLYRFKGICTAADVTALDGPGTLTVGEQGTFMGTMNEDASTPVTYAMDFGDGASASEMTASHTYSRAGSYTVRLSATNCAGTTTASMPVTVEEPCNAAQIVTMTASNLNPDTRSAVSFSANVSGSAPVGYNWNFGDGATSTQASPSHTYSQPGTYTVTLEATNCGGTTRRTLTVTARPFEPPYCASLSEMNTAYFGRNSSTLTEEGRTQLQENLQILRDCTQLSVRIEGWAAPGERNAQQLSEDRARAVEQFYIDNGIAASRAVTNGRGAATGATKDGASQYQRADSIPLRN